MASRLAATELESRGPLAFTGRILGAAFFKALLFFSSLFFAVISRSFLLSMASGGTTYRGSGLPVAIAANA